MTAIKLKSNEHIIIRLQELVSKLSGEEAREEAFFLLSLLRVCRSE